MVQLRKKKPKENLAASRPVNILVVCHGNICRSPLASAILVLNLGEERIRSRGLRAKPGCCVAKKVRDYVKGMKIEKWVNAHKSQRATQEDVDWADLIVFMDNSNMLKLLEFENASTKMICLGIFINKPKIQDPNFMPRGDELEELLDEIVAAANALALQSKNV